MVQPVNLNGCGKVGISDFDLLKVLGTGAYGKVFLVRKTHGSDCGKLYAMKVLKKATIVQKQKTLEHAKTERQVLESIRQSPFLVTLHYAFQTDSKLHLVLGTTWLQEIIYCVLNGTLESQNQSLEDRFPYLEFIYPGLASIEKMEGQRLIKTHLPFSILPEDIHKKKPKIFYIMRNPKDVAVSYYHFVRMMTITDYTASFDNFFEDFISDKVAYGPFWKHYTEAWQHQKDSNVLLLFYEDLHKDIHGSIRRIADFLNKDLSEEEINEIADHCAFRNMSKNPNVNYQHWDDLGIRKTSESRFMRKGQVGDWRNYFSEEKNNLMDSWIDEKFMGIHFTYDNLKV